MQKIDVSIGISARHIHLKKETYVKLFNKELTVKNPLNQPGQFAANETVTLKTEKGCIENVRIVGPLRDYDQVEISAYDARVLGLEPPVKRSGDLDKACEVKVCTSLDEVTIKGCIIPERHVHMSEEKALELGVQDKQNLKLEIPGYRSGVVDVKVKIEKDGFFEVHLDTDDANAFLIKKDTIGKLII